MTKPCFHPEKQRICSVTFDQDHATTSAWHFTSFLEDTSKYRGAMAILNRINEWLSILTASTDGRLDCNEFGLKEDRSDAHWRDSNFEESIFSSLQALSFNYALKTDLTSCLMFILSHNNFDGGYLPLHRDLNLAWRLQTPSGWCYSTRANWHLAGSNIHSSSKDREHARSRSYQSIS